MFRSGSLDAKYSIIVVAPPDGSIATLSKIQNKNVGFHAF